MNKFSRLLTGVILSFTTLISCQNYTNIDLIDIEASGVNTFKAENEKSRYLKQLEMVLQKYPEASKEFVNWQPEDKEGFDLKKELAQSISKSNKNLITKNDISKILTEQPQIKSQAFKPISFDTDQGEHKSKFTEWWYYNGHLNSAEGKNYGYELCFFRATPVIYFVHVAITDENNQKFYYSRTFHSPLKVKMDKNKGNVQYGNNIAKQTDDFSYKVSGEVDKFKFDLNLNMTKGPLLINGNGLINMPEGKDSYYYSLTKLSTTGTISENGKTFPVTGQSWFDHQWGNFYVMRTGWDWFSFQMEDNTEYNLFSFRSRKDATLEQHVNILDSRNKSQHSKKIEIKRLNWWQSPNTSDLYVTKWQLKIPDKQETFIVEAVVPGQEVYPTKIYDIAPSYWEGRCKVTKILPDGREIKGLAYTEHFAYQNKIE